MIPPALPIEIQKLLATPEPADLGPGPRAGVWPAGRIDDALKAASPRVCWPASRHQLVRAIVLLWHDHLDGAHGIVQELEDQDGCYVHAILHRREPDYGNAKYWFRRVGSHPCHAELAGAVSALRKARDHKTRQEPFVAGGTWNAMAFVDACEAMARDAGNLARGEILREIQRLEVEMLLAHLCQPG